MASFITAGSKLLMNGSRRPFNYLPSSFYSSRLLATTRGVDPVLAKSMATRDASEVIVIRVVNSSNLLFSAVQDAEYQLLFRGERESHGKHAKSFYRLGIGQARHD